jgi:hypothetical protein
MTFRADLPDELPGQLGAAHALESLVEGLFTRLHSTATLPHPFTRFDEAVVA